MLRQTLWIASAIMALSSGAFACDGRLIENERVYGSPICIPENLERVVVLDPTFSLGIGLELGLPIVGAPLTKMSDKILAQRAKEAGVVDLGFVTEPNLERIVALEPDLILGFTGDVGLAESFYPIFSSFAPTMMDVSGDWQEYYNTIAELTGSQDKVEELFAAYNQRLADVRAQIPDRSISIIRITSWDFQVYTDSPNSYAPFKILSEAGVKRSAYETAPNGPSVKRPDWEEMAALDGDILLYIVGGTNASDTNGRLEEVIENPLWKMLPAVQSGNVHRIDPATWMEFNGLGSASNVLADIEKFIINAP